MCLMVVDYSEHTDTESEKDGELWAPLKAYGT